MNTTAFDIARRFVGIHEAPGAADNPFIRWCHSVTSGGEAGDDVPWCSSFVNAVAFILDLPRTRSKAARSWLAVDAPAIDLHNAMPGFDVVIFKRGGGAQPGADVLNAPGHVAFYSHADGDYVVVLGGNQGDAVSLSRYPIANVLGVRRLYP